MAESEWSSSAFHTDSIIVQSNKNVMQTLWCWLIMELCTCAVFDLVSDIHFPFFQRACDATWYKHTILRCEINYMNTNIRKWPQRVWQICIWFWSNGYYNRALLEDLQLGNLCRKLEGHLFSLYIIFHWYASVVILTLSIFTDLKCIFIWKQTQIPVSKGSIFHLCFSSDSMVLHLTDYCLPSWLC